MVLGFRQVMAFFSICEQDLVRTLSVFVKPCAFWVRLNLVALVSHPSGDVRRCEAPGICLRRRVEALPTRGVMGSCELMAFASNAPQDTCLLGIVVRNMQLHQWVWTPMKTTITSSCNHISEDINDGVTWYSWVLGRQLAVTAAQLFALMVSPGFQILSNSISCDFPRFSTWLFTYSLVHVSAWDRR